MRHASCELANLIQGRLSITYNLGRICGSTQLTGNSFARLKFGAKFSSSSERKKELKQNKLDKLKVTKTVFYAAVCLSHESHDIKSLPLPPSQQKHIYVSDQEPQPWTPMNFVPFWTLAQMANGTRRSP